MDLKRKYCEVNNYFVDLFILISTFMMLYPVTQLANIHDDAVYYYLKGGMLNSGYSFWEIIKSGFLSSVAQGRFFPLSLHSYIVYFLVNQNEVLYKSLIILFVCIDIAVFGKFVYDLFENKKIKWIAMISMSAFFQVYTVYHNAITGYHLFMQIMVLLLFLMLDQIYKYAKTEKKKFLLLAVIYATISMLLYEIGYIYVCLGCLFYAGLKKKFKPLLKVVTCFSIPTVVLGLITIYCKSIVDQKYAGVSVKVDLIRIIKTWIKQCYAAFPLSHTISWRNSGWLPSGVKGYLSYLDFYDIVCLLMVGTIVVYAFYCYSYPEKTTIQFEKIKFPFLILFFGFSFALIGFLPALTQKYQDELTWGIAHISVYIQYYMLCLVFLIVALYIWKKIIKCKRCFANILIGGYIIVLLTTVYINRQNAESYTEISNVSIKYPKQIIRDALENGIFNFLPENATIVYGTNYVWNGNDFFTEFSNKKVQSLSFEEYIDQKCTDANESVVELKNDNSYYLEYEGNKRFGVVKLALINTLRKEGEKWKIETDRICIYTDLCDSKICYETSGGSTEIIDFEQLDFFEKNGDYVMGVIDSTVGNIDINQVGILSCMD